MTPQPLSPFEREFLNHLMCARIALGPIIDHDLVGGRLLVTNLCDTAYVHYSFKVFFRIRRLEIAVALTAGERKALSDFSVAYDALPWTPLDEASHIARLPSMESFAAIAPQARRLDLRLRMRTSNAPFPRLYRFLRRWRQTVPAFRNPTFYSGPRTEFVQESDLDFEAIYARGGANCGNEDYLVFKCAHCDGVFLVDSEVDTVFPYPADLKRRFTPSDSEPTFACSRCGRQIGLGSAYGAHQVAIGYRPETDDQTAWLVTHEMLRKSPWSWLLRERPANTSNTERNRQT